MLYLVENGPRPTKEWIFQQVYHICRKLGVKFKLLRHSQNAVENNSWFREYLRDEDVLKADLRYVERTVDVISRNKVDSATSFYTYLEEAVPITNALAHHFGTGFPISLIPNASNLRRKDQMAACLRNSAHMRLPTTIGCSCASEVAEALELMASLGHRKCVLKPVEMGSSYGVTTIHAIWDDSAKSAYEHAIQVDFEGENLRQQFGLSRDVVIQEYIERDLSIGEVSVDGLVEGGELRTFTVTEKHVRSEPLRMFAEIGHSANLTQTQEQHAAYSTILREIIQGLSLHTTAFHAEFILARGQPVFVELGARLGGDLIPQLVELATGQRLVEASVLAVLGRDTQAALTKIVNRGASIVFARPQRPERCRDLASNHQNTIEVLSDRYLITSAPTQKQSSAFVKEALMESTGITGNH